MPKFYEFIECNTAVIKDNKVYATTEQNYVNRKQYRAASRVQVGAFKGLVKYLNRKHRYFVVTRSKIELKNLDGAKEIGSMDQYDGMSLSSVNRPWSKLVKAVYDKANAELMFNPFGLITDATRNMSTFVYKHPIIKTEEPLTRLAAKSRLELKLSANGRVRKEMPGLFGVVIYVDSDQFIEYLTGLPLSLKGDGIVVTEHWLDNFEIKDIETGEYVDVPFPFKMQGVARSKGMTIGRTNKNVEIRYKGMMLPVDVVMNTQKTRKNVVANLVASGMRLRKYAGEEVDVIPAYSKDALKDMARKYKFIEAPVFVDGMKIGKAIVGIGKFYLDLTNRTNPRPARAYVTYPQVYPIQDISGFHLNSRVVKQDKAELYRRANKAIDVLVQAENFIENTNHLMHIARDVKDVASSLEALKELDAANQDIYDLMLEAWNAPKVNGIGILPADIAEKFDGIEALPIPLKLIDKNASEFKIPVVGKLTWDASLVINLDELEDEELYAVSVYTTGYIYMLHWLYRMAAAGTVKDYEIRKSYLLNRIKYMKASVLKQVVVKPDFAPSIRGIHITLQEKCRFFAVPRKELLRRIRNPHRNMAVVYNNGDKYLVFAADLEHLDEILDKAGITNRTIITVSEDAIKDMLKNVKLDDITVIGSIVRHPIIGCLTLGEFKPMDIDGIGSPADISEKLDGDDDGDNIDAIPLVVVLDKIQVPMYTTI